MHANSVLLIQDGTNMAMPKKKATPKKKIGKDLTDVKAALQNKTIYKDKKGDTRITQSQKNSYAPKIITVSKQGKSGFSSVKEKTGLGGKNDPRKGRVAPIAQVSEKMKNGNMSSADSLRRTSTYLNNKRKKK
jgi:hypothetical protein